MTVIDKIKTAQKTLFTFELMPPLKGNSFDEIAQTVEQLLPYHPAYINITNHRTEQVLVEHPDGSIEKLTLKKRAGTASIAAAIQYKYGIDVVPHLVCGGCTRSEIEDMLTDFDFLGIHNVLVLRGDPAKGEQHFVPTKDGYRYAVEALQQAMQMNAGHYLDESLHDAHSTHFCAGVAGYPEMHSESSDFDADLLHLKNKVEQGASYIVTQMFFDNQKYFRFVNECRKIGIEVPIIPGIKPLATSKQLTVLPQIFHIELPQKLVDNVQRCTSPQDVRKVGQEWCLEQCTELIKHKVPALHFYTMSKADNVETVVRAIFG
ncbi:methylenetetrahydrofolate reductase [Bacteroidia bacterium]|nr:methylenetetrahydrofolate reductase [Bacteroidia bacterium]